MKNELRDYQILARQQILDSFKKGARKVMLWLATGGGKTTIFSDIMRSTQIAGNPNIMAVRGRELVDQASERLTRDGVRHGVLMANHWKKDAQALSQVCSIDTLMTRRLFPPAKLVVGDEGHLLTSDQSVEFFNHYQKSFVLSVTATPWTMQSLRHLADVVIHPITVDELMAEGYLIRPRYFAPSMPDLRGLRRINGDYVNEQLQERMSVLSGDIVKTWIKLGENRPTILFAVNLAHSMSLVETFRAAGVTAEHIDGTSTREQRQFAKERLMNGSNKVLCNVGVATTGVDIPPVSCIVNARPTLSYNLFIQMNGRGTRPVYAPGFNLKTTAGRLAAIEASNKKDFLILDHAANIIKHGFLTNEPEVDLDGIRKQKLDTGPSPSMCKTCYLIFTGPQCPTCGVRGKVERVIEIDEKDELYEINQLPDGAEIIAFVKWIKDTRKKRGYHKSWQWMEVKKKYGEELADRIFPKDKPKPRTPALPPWIARGKK